MRAAAAEPMLAIRRSSASPDDQGSRRAAGGPRHRFGILGHSLGGHTAYLYASRHPQRVESLILVDVGPPLTEELARGLWRAMQAQRTADDEAGLQRIGASAAFQAREPKAVETYILNIYAPFFRDRRTIEALDLGFTEVTAANVVDYEDRLVATLPEQDPLDRLSKISCPTLVIHGEVDPMPLEFSRLLADRIPGAQLAVISGGSHFPFIEDRDAFMVVVREFLGSWPESDPRTTHRGRNGLRSASAGPGEMTS